MKELDTLWNGAPVTQSIRYHLIEDDGRLRLQFSFPLGVRMHPAAVENTFTPELWMWDVGELFLAGKDGRYLELNLAPNGAWWMQGFESARVLDKSFDVEEFAVQVNGAELSISLYKLERYLGTKESWRVNVTAILQSPECEFLSLIQLPGEVADFHQPEVYGKYADIVIE